MTASISAPKPMRRIDGADRAELCRRIDFPAMLQGFGIEVRRRGSSLVCAIRPEQTPSCHLYAPGQGVLGHRGWTWHDYGDDKRGDALGYLIDCQGMDYPDAVRHLADITGFHPAGLGEDGGNVGKPRPKPRPMPVKVETPTMPPDEQAEACRIYLDALCEVHPGAEMEGKAYLGPEKVFKGRNVLPQGWPAVAFHQPPEAEQALAEAIMPYAELMIRAGLMRPADEHGPVRLQWGAYLGMLILLAHHDEQGRVFSFSVRRFEWRDGDRLPKYLHQSTGRGAQRIPFGLPSLYLPPSMSWRPAPAHNGELLIVEGPLDALGAACLGWSALGMGGMASSAGAHDTHSRTATMLDPHLPALRELRRICVLPDNDADNALRAKGIKLAGKLVAFLRAGGCRAEIVALDQLGIPMPEGCKDIADLAAGRKQQNEDEDHE